MRFSVVSPRIQALADTSILSDPWGLGWRIPVARAGCKALERRELARVGSDPLALRVNEILRRQDHAAADRVLAAAAAADAADAAPLTEPVAPSPLPSVEAEPDRVEQARQENARLRSDIATWYGAKRQAEDELMAEGKLTVFDLRTRDPLLEKAIDVVLSAGDALCEQKKPSTWEGVRAEDGADAPMNEESVRALLECDAVIEDGPGRGDELGAHLVGLILAHSQSVDLYRLRSLEVLEKNSERLVGGTSGGPSCETAES